MGPTKVDIEPVTDQVFWVTVDGKRFKKFTNMGLAWAHAKTIVDFYEFEGRTAELVQ